MDRWDTGKFITELCTCPAAILHPTESVLMLILLNQRAGSSSREGADVGDQLVAAFAAEGERTLDLRRVEPPDLPAAAAAAAAQSSCAIIAAGGDGTVSAVAAAVAHRQIPLGVIPLGTLNHFARDAGIPLELAAAVAVIVRGHTRDVDVGEVNGRLFLNTCSIGGYTDALRRREILRRRDGHGKWRAMLLGVVAALRRVPRLHVRLEGDGWEDSLRASFVLVVNNRYHDDALVSGRRQHLDAGELWVYASRAHRWRDLGRAAIEAWRRGLHQAPGVQSWSGQSLTLHCEETPLRAAVDGEIVRFNSPLRFRNLPGALRIFGPR